MDDVPEGVDALDTVRVIDRKRRGEELSAAELTALIEAYVRGAVGDEQLAAFLMAGVIQGFTTDEAAALTDAYVASGEVVDLSGLRGPTVDKHSTGGVGDTATLVVAPLAAACGLQVAKLSGRGLGHTGGTLDKLEAIPGFRVDLDPATVAAQVERIGVAVAAATDDLVPADRRIYALRDVTATVASPALIAASVMSKKIAGGAAYVLLDVKAGGGAFLEDVDAARDLAQLCVSLGERAGRRTRALITDMSQPLADAVGNALEVASAVRVLRGDGTGGELRAHAIALVAELLAMTGHDPSHAAATATRNLDDGTALGKFRELVEAQGGDPRVADVPWKILPQAPVRREWRVDPGAVERIDALGLGVAAARLGAGRRRKGDPVDPTVGLELRVRVGDTVGPDDAPAVVIHARTEPDADAVAARLHELVRTGPGPVEPAPWLLGRVIAEGEQG